MRRLQAFSGSASREMGAEGCVAAQDVTNCRGNAPASACCQGTVALPLSLAMPLAPSLSEARVQLPPRSFILPVCICCAVSERHGR